MTKAICVWYWFIFLPYVCPFVNFLCWTINWWLCKQNITWLRQSVHKRKAETVQSDTVRYYHRSKLCCLGIHTLNIRDYLMSKQIHSLVIRMYQIEIQFNYFNKQIGLWFLFVFYFFHYFYSYTLLQEAIAVVLDVGPSMNQAPPGVATPLETALDAVTMILQRKVSN